MMFPTNTITIPFKNEYHNSIDKNPYSLHLFQEIQHSYDKVTIYWDGYLYCGITLYWNYTEGHVDISIPGYMLRTLTI